MDFPHVVIARMYEHVEPIDRGDRYEDPLQDALDATNIGRVTGGGSQLNELGGIEFADVEIELADLDGALLVVKEALEKAGAPQGSELMTHRTAAYLPVGQHARVVIRHGKQSLDPREVRMPRAV